MTKKKILSIILICSLITLTGMGVSARDNNAAILQEDDYLLDGNFENGELVNGFIYYSREEAEAGILRDKEFENQTWADIPFDMQGTATTRSVAVMTAENETNTQQLEVDETSKEQYDATGYTQQIVSQNISSTYGSATLLQEDDYLLDGNFENGELVNGSIYYSKEEAEAGLLRDKEFENQKWMDISLDGATALDVYPDAGNAEGTDTYGNFYYTIREVCSFSSWYGDKKIRVDTQSQLYYSKDKSFFTSDDYSYIVTVTDENGTVGSFRGYSDDVFGGADMTGSKAYGSYWIKITMETKLPSYFYLNGSGKIKNR